jgi:hypothetical protein
MSERGLGTLGTLVLHKHNVRMYKSDNVQEGSAWSGYVYTVIRWDGDHWVRVTRTVSYRRAKQAFDDA